MSLDSISSIAASGLPSAAAMTALPAKDEKLGKACDQFEGMFLRQILNDGMKPMLAKPLGSGESGNDVYSYMTTDAMANDISGKSPLGISNLLQAQLAPKTHHPAPKATQ
jgi:Rod binding domain-containing protein